MVRLEVEAREALTTSAQVRDRLLEALRLDLIGPDPNEPGHEPWEAEELPSAPSKWYLTGFLVPHEAPLSARADDDIEESGELEGVGEEDGEEQGEGEGSRRMTAFPSSMGLSVLVPEGEDKVLVELKWGDYAPLEVPLEEEEAALGVRGGGGAWRRSARSAEVFVELRKEGPSQQRIEAKDDLFIVSSVRVIRGGGLVDHGTRAVSIFLVNQRRVLPESKRDSAFVFQPELRVSSVRGFVKRPDLKGHASEDEDERIADLQYHDAVEYAVGHNVSVAATLSASGECFEVRTAWMPVAQVEKVVPAELPELELRLERLGELRGEALIAALAPLETHWGRWLQTQRSTPPSDATHASVHRDLLDRAARSLGRLKAGLEALVDPAVEEAFRMTQQVMARAMRQRAAQEAKVTPEQARTPTWRPFQLAFLLINLRGLVDGAHPDREVVDLLFFPTGGGKTEAYLGLAAFTLLWRRLRDPSLRSAGVTVLMRYTLRLLTLDQLGRACALICALELERQRAPERLGAWPFEIGLWVGQGATPNRMGSKGDKSDKSARALTRRYKAERGRARSPIPLESCPWCGERFTADSFKLMPNDDEPTDLRIWCVSRDCAFNGQRQRERGLPLITVDEPIYRRLPAFLLATVDKFANLPWVGETGALFGAVERSDSAGFYGPMSPNRGRSLGGPLQPPALIIQDELHLISGPLGTMVGLYETAIDGLCARDGAPRPKVIASTATVRRAQQQIQAIFGRSEVDVFPPQSPDRRDAFFAKTVPASEQEPRTYVGLAAQGRNMKVVLLRACVTLMAAAAQAWAEAEPHRTTDAEGRRSPNPADPYMTLLGYFNALRELGGSRRILEDEVTMRVMDYADRRRRLAGGGRRPLFRDRPRPKDPVELTSRVSTADVADVKRRLEVSWDNAEQRVDMALATNMISVGLDITRLGLMVVLGQPKSTSEYIQATSRVGRDERRPGLVVTLLNLHRPRDRSHYERFILGHETFYRAVEATSVTPFSPRALDRGLAGVVVAMSRLSFPELTPPNGALAVRQHRSKLDIVAELLAARAEGHANMDRSDAEALRQRVRAATLDLLDTWVKVADHRGALQYQAEQGGAPPLLYAPLDPELRNQSTQAQRFRANRSLRDVEPSVRLRIRRLDGGALEE